jgi:hypothetical protein
MGGNGGFGSIVQRVFATPNAAGRSFSAETCSDAEFLRDN